MSFMTAEHARTVAQPRKLHQKEAFFTPGRVRTLKDLILPHILPNLMMPTGVVDPRIRYEWNVRIMGASTASTTTPPEVPRTAYMPRGPISPWYIDEHYGDDGESNADQLGLVNADFEAAVDLATRWLVTGEEAAAEASIRIITAWATITGFESNAGSVLNWNNKWPVLLQAALMMKDHPSYIPSIHLAMQDVTRRGLVINSALTHDNNWGAWGVCHLFAAALFLEDRVLFDRAIQRWRTLFDIAVVNNVPVDEVYRQSSGQGNGSFGLWYSNFTMSGFTVAAEWARFGGVWLYDYKGADGSTFKGLYENVRHWSRYPTEYPYNTSGTPSGTPRIMAHDDILHALWPDPESQWLLDNFPTGSVRDNYGMRQTVLAYRYRPLIG